MSHPQVIVTLLALAFSVGLVAQANTPSASEESFRVMPKTVAPEATNVAIRLEARTPDLFASESSRTPRLSFSTGVTLVANSFQLLSPSEAQATINVAKEAAGTVEVRVTIYSVDGKKAIRQERGTLGISSKSSITLNNLDVPGQSAGTISLSTSSVELIRTNVDEPQQLGDIVIDGRATGDVVINPPSGTVFVSGSVPVVAVETGTSMIQLPRLDPGLGAFRFTIANPSYAAIKVRVSNISVDTSSFSRLGGTAGVLTTSVSGFGLGPGYSGGSAAKLVANAHTALAKLEGTAITDTGLTPDAPAPTTPTTPTSQSTTYANTGGISPSTGNRDRENDEGRRRRENEEAERRRNEWRNRMNTQGQPSPQAPVGSTFYGGGGRWAGGVNSGRVNDFRDPGQASSSAGASGGGSSGGGSGFGGPSGATVMSRGGTRVMGGQPGQQQPVNADSGKPVGHEPSSNTNFADYRQSRPVMLATSQKLYFADRDWSPLSGVILQPGETDNQRSRVWIVLERGATITDQVDTVSVNVRFGRTLRQVTLTETGPSTGVFRCDPAGIEVAAVGVYGEVERVK